MDDLKVQWHGPTRLYYDNKSAISIVHNSIQHDITKHVEMDRHFIKEKLDKGLICTPYVSLNDQLTDMLTKGLSSTMFQRFVCKIGMNDIHSQSWGGVSTIGVKSCQQ